jgi:uncharacterized glyoxalase superfamily protein PhnB
LSEYGTAAIGFDLGPILIVKAIDEADPEDQALAGRFVGCSLAVEDIDATYAALTAKGVAFRGPPERQPWGGVLARAIIF